MEQAAEWINERLIWISWMDGWNGVMVFGCSPHFSLTRSSLFIAPGLADRRSFQLQSLLWGEIETSSSPATPAREDRTVSGASDYYYVPVWLGQRSDVGLFAGCAPVISLAIGKHNLNLQEDWTSRRNCLACRSRIIKLKLLESCMLYCSV